MKLEEMQPPTEQQVADASGVAKRAASDWGDYCRKSRKNAAIIKSVLQRYLGLDLAGKVVLDWGGGLGGVSIVLSETTKATIAVSDVDRSALDWLRKAMPTILAAAAEPCEALPIPDKFCDCVFGISVLTHIPPDWQEFYVKELARITKGGGVVAISLLSNSRVLSNARAGGEDDWPPTSITALDEAGCLYRSYDPNVLAQMKFSSQIQGSRGDYGVTYHSRKYASKLFEDDFNVMQIMDAAFGKQDLIVAIRR